MLVTVLVATAPTGWLPQLANAVIREYLRARELSAIQVRVERLSPWHLQAAVQAGTNAPFSQVKRVALHFSPAGLYHSRLERVELSDGVLPFRATTNGLVCCGLPQDLARLRPGPSPLQEEEDVPPRAWQVGTILLDRITLRLLPPASQAAAEPYDLCLQATALAGPEETRIMVADFGRVGSLANGALRPETGDGWLVLTLPESQVQEWLRVAQWFVREPRWQGRDLCVGNGGATILFRMEQWRPALCQADFSLRGAARLEEVNLAGDLRVHGVARWLPEDEGRPTISAQAELGVRMASAPGVAWADDREQPARAAVTLQVTPQRAEWQCQVAARANLSHEAVRACLPQIAGVYDEALGVRLDGTFASPDWQIWNGAATAMLLDTPAGWAPRDEAWQVQNLLVQATAFVTNSMLAAVRGQLEGRWAAGLGAIATGSVSAALVAVPPFAEAHLDATMRVESVTLPSGGLVWGDGQPWQAAMAAALRRTPAGVTVEDAQLTMAPTPLVWQSGTGEELRAVLTATGSGGYSNLTQGQVGLCLTAVTWRAVDLTGGAASVSLRATMSPTAAAAPVPLAPRLELAVSDGWLRDANEVMQLDGLQLRVPLAYVSRGLQAAGAPLLAWDRLACRGLSITPEGFALTTTAQSVLAHLQVGVKELGVPASAQVCASWSNAWNVQTVVEIPATILADTEGVRGLVRQWTGQALSLTGQVAATAAVTLAAGKAPVVRLQAAVTNLDVSGLAEPWQVAGIAAQVVLDGPRGWRTPQGQVLSFRSAKKGNLRAEDARVQWQFRREAFLVEQADLQWCRGALHVYGVTYNIHNPDLNCVLYADKIHLGSLMAQTKALQGTGDANLFGRIPVRIQNGKLRLLESYLHTSPGEAGVLKLADDRLVDAALPEGSLNAGVRDKLRSALQNLNLSVFRVQLSGSGTNAVLGMHITGRPAEDDRAQPIELNVNFHCDLDQLLDYGEGLMNLLP